jgi:hypothetical protein
MFSLINGTKGQRTYQVTTEAVPSSTVSLYVVDRYNILQALSYGIVFPVQGEDS